jgi:hypothetical protein
MGSQWLLPSFRVEVVLYMNAGGRNDRISSWSDSLNVHTKNPTSVSIDALLTVIRSGSFAMGLMMTRQLCSYGRHSISRTSNHQYQSPPLRRRLVEASEWSTDCVNI